MKQAINTHKLSLVLIAMMLCFGIIRWESLPETLRLFVGSYDFGEASKLQFLVMSPMYLVFALFIVWPDRFRRAPKANPGFHRNLRGMGLIFTVTVGVYFVLTIISALRGEYSLQQTLSPYLLFLSSILLGNNVTKTERYGSRSFRLPFVKEDRVFMPWNRFYGKLMVIGGVVGLCLYTGFALEKEAYIIGMVGPLVVSVLTIPYFYKNYGGPSTVEPLSQAANPSS